MKALPCLLVSSLALGMGVGCASSEGSGTVEPGIAVPPSGFTGGGFVGIGVPTNFPGALGPSGRPLRLEAQYQASRPPPAISGGTLAVSDDGAVVVAADPDRDSVYVVEVASLRVQKLSLPAGSEPGRVVFDGSGGAHVALRGSGKLLRVDLASATFSTFSDVCSQPRGVAFDAKNNTVMTACMDGQLVSLDAVTHQEKARETLSQDLRDVVVDKVGGRWLSRYRSAELLTRQDDGSVKSSKPRAGKVRHLGSLFGPRSGPMGATAGLGVATDSDPQEGLVNMSPALAWRALPSKSGGVWMLHQQSQDDQVVVTEGGYGSGCRTITAGAITEFSGAGDAMRTMPINLQGLSVDAALSPGDKWVAVASPGGFARSSTTLQVYSTENMPSEPDPDQCPIPLTVAAGESQTTAVAFDGAGVLYALSREPAELELYKIETFTGPMTQFGSPGLQSLTRLATIALDRGSVRDTGHDLFHADVGQGLACASCHGEALDDGHVWNFDKIGPRRTQNIRGGFLRTAPFHWDGDMENMGHLVDDVMTGRMGGFKVEAGFADALAQWIDHQPAFTVPARDTAAVARGKTLFESAETKCSTCHSGPNFTNNESADVGTGGKFQVPGLLGLSLHAPFMHTGCAKTLTARFADEKCGGGNSHGKTSQLSEAQRADLVAYMSSL